MACLLLHGNKVLESVAASFVSAYAALWLSLLYDAVALVYNRLYDKITETTDTNQETGPDPSEAGSTDAVQKMQIT